MDRILFQFGPLTIYTFGFAIAVGTLTAYLLAIREAKRNGLDEEKLSTLILVILLAGVLGARIFFVLFYQPAYYWHNPADIFKLYEGGLSIHGGILGALLAGLWYTKRVKLPFWKTSDLIAPAAVLGQGIARVGCDVYGKVMSGIWPWGIEVNGLVVHPVQIYEALLDLALFVFLWGQRSRQKYTGQIFVYYLGGYALIRLILEFFRTNPTIIGDVTPAHLTSSAFIVVSYALNSWLGKRNPGEIIAGIPSSTWVAPLVWGQVIILALVNVMIFYALAG